MFSQSVINKIKKIAADLGVEPAALLAVAEVESAGVDTWVVNGKNLPAIRFEGHYFYKRLKGAKLQKAIEQGLASPKAGAVKNPTSYSARYALLDRAAKIDETAAYESTSWGLGQVMGAHWKKLGYASVQDLVAAAKKGADGQVEIMAKFIKAFGLVTKLRNKDWPGFAGAYNGPAYRVNRYDTKMASAYKRWSKELKGILAKEDNAISVYQKDLKTLGFYTGPVDGIAGPQTKRAIRAFQKAQGLVEDGEVGPNTRAALDQELAQRSSNQAGTAIQGGTVVTGAGGLGQVVLEQAQNLLPLGDYSNTIRLMVAFVTILGIGLILYGVWKNRNG